MLGVQTRSMGAWLIVLPMLATSLVAFPRGRDRLRATRPLTRSGIPPVGHLYHSVYPGGVTGEEDDITLAGLRSYERTVGKKAAWVYFSHNWYKSTAFPRQTAGWIRAAGAAPFIRLVIRDREGSAVSKFTVEAILAGELDASLKAWAIAAKRFATPLIVEYGTECNGYWFPWNGRYHGGGQTDGFGDPTKPDGPERFAAAYRHIITLMRSEGARNITWVFHVAAADDPEEPWNRWENYYPGDDVVDWIGVSVYGPQQPADTEAKSFRQQMDPFYARLDGLNKGKPVIVAEFGCTAGSLVAQPDKWAAAALEDILSRRWSRVIGFSWWNERWENDDNPSHDTTMRVQDIPALAAVFRDKLSAHQDRVLERVVPPELYATQ